MMIPHHICYLEGYRGIRWADFDERYSPLVEIVSMHGCAEEADAPRPYLHSMGPRDGRSTMLQGLRQGRRFGVIGSTDHHSAHPGSHNHGRCAVWARELTREGVWEALQSRRTYALTGDRIGLAFSINDVPMGSVLSPDADRTLKLEVTAGGPIDYVEIVKNGAPLARKSPSPARGHTGARFRGKVTLAVGWGEQPDPTDWDVTFGVRRGDLLGVEPRFSGEESVSPQSKNLERYQVSSWDRVDARTVRFRTRTSRNPNTSTDRTQKFTIEIEGDAETEVAASINGREICYPLSELRDGPRADYLDGFVSEAYQISRAVPEDEYIGFWELNDRGTTESVDFYYARIRQKNDQWAWTSPIWI
jgi:hypothetical protein